MNNDKIRKKRYATKVRTGCVTCRIRRVKCDEHKPSCHRCTSTGRKCDGYSSATCGFGSDIRPSALPAGSTDSENQAIYQFRTRIASLIASSFDTKFWTHDLLHKADSFTPVRQALAGLASAYQKSILLDTQSASCDQFIFGQYNKAIRSLYTCFQDGKYLSEDQRVAALMVNFLFMCLCSLQGLRQEAFVHLRNGLSLIHEWGLNIGNIGDRPAHQSMLMVNILALYVRLDTQARVIATDQDESASLLWGAHSLHPPLEGNDRKPSICQALLQLEAVHNQLLQLPGHQSPPGSNLSYRQTLSCWDTGFQILAASTKDQSNHITALRMRRTVVEVTLKYANYSAGDGCNDSHCKTILDLAHQLIRGIQLRADQRGFYLSNGLVEALYFVAVKSKDWDLRQQAIDTLRHYRFIDGVWGSDAAADLAAAHLQTDMTYYLQHLETPSRQHGHE